MDLAGEAPYVEAGHLKQQGFDVDLLRGLCVKRIDKKTFNKLRQVLDAAGAQNGKSLRGAGKAGEAPSSDVRGREPAVWLCFGNPERQLNGLERAAKRKGAAVWWTATKSARRGDRLVFYMIRPMLAFLATGVAASDAWLNDDRKSEWYGRYCVDVGHVEMLPRPVSLSSAQEWFPNWDYLRTPRRSARVPNDVAGELLMRLRAEPQNGRSSRSSKNLLLSCDTSEPPDRIIASVVRVVRDTVAARRLKELYNRNCQVCGKRIECGDGSYYVEVHHLRPLGKHDGLDDPGNMLVLCPNHHALFDFGVPRFLSASVIEISGERHRLTCEHKIAQNNIDYYRRSICRQP